LVSEEGEALRNPLRSEAEAFRFLITTIIFFAAIVGARLLMGAIVALVVAIVGVALIGWLLRGDPSAGAQAPRLVVRDHDPDDGGEPSQNGAQRPTGTGRSAPERRR
jgi:hypothetical protein